MTLNELTDKFLQFRSTDGDITSPQYVATAEALYKEMVSFRFAHVTSLTDTECSDLTRREQYLGSLISMAKESAALRRGPVHFPKPEYEDEE